MYVYTRGCTYERARRHREREKSLFPSRMRRHGRCQRKENGHTDRGAETARDPAAKFAVSFRRDLSIPLSLSLPLYLSSSAPLRARSRVYVRDARGVTYPPGKPHSDIDSRHFAVPLAPDDTRKPNGKRKYDTDFRSMETNSGNSWQILAQDCSPSATVPAATGFDLHPHPASTCPQSHPNAGNSTIGRDNCRIAIGRTHCFAFPPFAKNGADRSPP